MTRGITNPNTRAESTITITGTDSSPIKVVKTSDEVVEALSETETISDSITVSPCDPSDMTSDMEIDSLSPLIELNARSEVSVIEIVSAIVLRALIDPRSGLI